MRVLAIVGSLRRSSYNGLLLRAAARLVPQGAVFELWSAIGELPAYNEDLDGGDPPAAAVRLRKDIADVDGVLFATPEYNSSVPGGLKNLVDWASRPYATNVLRRKPVAVIGASTGFFGAVWAQAELRKVLSACGARVLDRELPIARASEAFSADGWLTDPKLDSALAEIVHELVRLARLQESRTQRSYGSGKRFLSSERLSAGIAPASSSSA